MTHDDYLAHHKYGSKVGGPGHWKYIYTTQSNGVGIDGAGPNVSRSTTYHTPLADDAVAALMDALVAYKNNKEA